MEVLYYIHIHIYSIYLYVHAVVSNDVVLKLKRPTGLIGSDRGRQDPIRGTNAVLKKTLFLKESIWNPYLLTNPHQ